MNINEVTYIDMKEKKVKKLRTILVRRLKEARKLMLMYIRVYGYDCRYGMVIVCRDDKDNEIIITANEVFDVLESLNYYLHSDHSK